jgi:hypothetical protein
MESRPRLIDLESLPGNGVHSWRVALRQGHGYWIYRSNQTGLRLAVVLMEEHCPFAGQWDVERVM